MSAETRVESAPAMLSGDELIRQLRKLRRPFMRPKVVVAFPQRLGSRACEAQVARTEELLGFTLPPFLRRVYCEVANGGFGPGYGLIGAEGGKENALGESLAGAYQSQQAMYSPSWPDQLVPLVSWGGGTHSCGNFAELDCPLFLCDPAVAPRRIRAMSDLPCHARSLQEWLGRWVSGDPCEPPE